MNETKTTNSLIKELRKQAKLSQEELAEKSGVSVSAIRKYETGERTPSLGSALQIALELNKHNPDAYDQIMEFYGYSGIVPVMLNDTIGTGNINEVLKQIRREAGLTQKELAEKTGISISNIQKYEIGASNPVTGNIITIGNVLENYRHGALTRLLIACGAKIDNQPASMNETKTSDDLINRQAAINALWKALYEYEDKTEKQFIESEELDVGDWGNHRIFVQHMNDIDRQTILDLPPAQPDLSDYSDRLWKAAYERGKADGVKLCTEEIGSVFGQIFPSEERRKDGQTD